MDLPDINWPEIDLPKLLSRFDAMTGALVVWGAMISVILLFLFVAAVMSLTGLRRRNRADAAAAAVPEHLIMTAAERARLRAEAAELIRQAAATAAAAKRAVQIVEENRARAEAAHAAREAAWKAFDEAQRAYASARADINRAHEESAPTRAPSTGPTEAGTATGTPAGTATGTTAEPTAGTTAEPTAGTAVGIRLEALGDTVGQLQSVTTAALATALENVDRVPAAAPQLDDATARREMSRAALAAFRRGDLSVEQLGAVFRQATGWDPLMELHAREVELRRSAESRARRLFQAAAAAERMAYHAADVAVVAAHALAEEAVALAAEADEARELLNAVVAVSLNQAQRKGRKRKRAARKRAVAKPLVAARTAVAKTAVRIPRQRVADTELSKAG